MRYSQLLIKTNKEAKTYDSVNATLLQKGCFIDQTMAGVYTFLPLGWRVLNKIENIIREEMDQVGAEMLMPAIVPKELWEKTGRLNSVDILMQAAAANDASRIKNDASYVLNSTHEEVITPIAQKLKPSYKDLPFAVYQIQTKFRNEARPKSGLLRGREFRMKDLYSFHASEKDMTLFYDQIKDVYSTIFNRLGIGRDTFIVQASGGDFTKGYSHEFDTLCANGEDIIYHDESNDTYYNKEVAPPELQKIASPLTASEVGNIFPLGTKFSAAFGYSYTAADGRQQPVYMASYGIGSSRVMGVIVEKFHDRKGIIWPPSVAPFTLHLIGINLDNNHTKQKADEAYKQLTSTGLEVLYDDRADVSAGEKLADADLLGIPWRLVISDKTGDQIELKERSRADLQMLALNAVVSRFTHEAD